MGLNPASSYYILIVRNIAPSGLKGVSAFSEYVQQPHMMAWRLTPKTGPGQSRELQPSAGHSYGQHDNSQQGLSPVSFSRGQEALSQSNVTNRAGFAMLQEASKQTPSNQESMPDVVYPAATMTSRTPLLSYVPQISTEQFLSMQAEGQGLRMPWSYQQQRELSEDLFSVLGATYSDVYDLSWGLGSVSPLHVLGVDSGLDCLQQKLDWCNGGSRRRSAVRQTRRRWRRRHIAACSMVHG